MSNPNCGRRYDRIDVVGLSQFMITAPHPPWSMTYTGMQLTRNIHVGYNAHVCR